MRNGIWLGCLAVSWATVAGAETVPDPLKVAVAQCDLCLAAVAEIVPPATETGAETYAVFRVEKVFFSSAKVDLSPSEVTSRLTVTLRRGTPALVQGEKYVLFLQRTGPAIEPVWVTAAEGPSMFSYSEVLARKLEEIGMRMTVANAGARRAGRRPLPVNLNGEWLLTLPGGYEYAATIESTGSAGEYRLLTQPVNLRGVYRLEGPRLTVTDPANKRLKGLVWDVLNNNALLLIEQPIPSPVGADYRRATLTRQKPVER